MVQICAISVFSALSAGKQSLRVHEIQNQNVYVETMKFLPFLVFILLVACAEKPHKPFYKPLTEDEMYAVINEGFAPYIRASEKDSLVYGHFFEMVDSGFVQKRIWELQGQQPKQGTGFMELVIYEEGALRFEEQAISQEKLIGLTTLTANQTDSIKRTIQLYMSMDTDDRPLMDRSSMIWNFDAISRPYRPTGSPFAVIETFPRVEFMSCFPAQIRYYFFSQRNGKWTLVHIV